jgi:hypothetical protein
MKRISHHGYPEGVEQPKHLPTNPLILKKGKRAWIESLFLHKYAILYILKITLIFGFDT